MVEPPGTCCVAVEPTVNELQYGRPNVGMGTKVMTIRRDLRRLRWGQ